MNHPYKPIYYESDFSMLVERDENLEGNIWLLPQLTCVAYSVT